MARGISLNIGVNRVDPRHYGKIDVLQGCVLDALDMALIALSEGFATHWPLWNERATRDAVTTAIKRAAGQLHRGDFFLLTFSGHGGTVPDTNHDESRENDQTWLLYDCQLIDDELHELLALFDEGVRVLVLSDSCYSGSVLSLTQRARRLFVRENDLPAVRALLPHVARRVYLRNRACYDQVQLDHPLGRAATVNASVLLLSACEDNETADDGPRNGRFTAALRRVWNNGAFRDSYVKFHEEIYSIVVTQNELQRPDRRTEGVVSAAFELQRPFTI
ncbi:MAG TPA: caspase family protein [Longimicrobium sp.]|nr:caspase family protein [Longimicrobium sp.]